MPACILVIHLLCAGGAPPDSPRVDPVSMYVHFLRSHLRDIRWFEEDIQRLKAQLRRAPGAAEHSEKLLLKCYEMRDRALRSCYRDVCGLLEEYQFQVWYAFRRFVADWSQQRG